MRRHIVLSAVLLAACSDTPVEPDHQLRRAVHTGASEITGVEWVKSSSGIDMIVLGRFNGRNVYPLDINDAGDVVGQYDLDTPIGTRPRAFVWRNGAFTDLGALGGYGSVAHSINEAGVIAGWAAVEGEQSRPVVWEGGTMRELLPPSGASAAAGAARAINAAGEVVGWYNNLPMKWTASGATNLPVSQGPPVHRRSFAHAINNTGRIMGNGFVTSTSPISQPAWIFENDVLSVPSLPAGSSLASIWIGQAARVLNDAGDYVGTTKTSDGKQLGFVVRGGQMQMLPSVLPGAPGVFILGLGINAAGDVAGFETGSNSAQHALVWQRSGNPVDLGTAPDDFQSQAHGINNNGLVVGTTETLGMTGPITAGAIWRMPPADDTPPVISPSVSGTLGANGWYVSDVQVSWNVGDPESGIASSSGCGSVTLWSDAVGASVTCSATNNSNITTSQTIEVKRDATAPTVAYESHPATYTVDQFISIACNATDALSGIDSQNCQSISGDASSFGVGPHQFSASAVDLAGNRASAVTSFTVIVSYKGLMALTRRYVTDEHRAEQLVRLLQLGEAAYVHKKPHLAVTALKVYGLLVRLMVDQAVSAENATVLTGLAAALAEPLSTLGKPRRWGFGNRDD
jgi:probable HAF family extracellular repeat protein